MGPYLQGSQAAFHDPEVGKPLDVSVHFYPRKAKSMLPSTH